MLDELDEQSEQLLESAITALELAWRGGYVRDLTPFLPLAEAPLRRLILMELIKVDQEYRLRHGELQFVEAYLQTWQELAEDDEALVVLVEAECLTRALRGDRASRAELRERFPKLESRIGLESVLAECDAEHQQMGSRETTVFNPAATDTSPIPPGILQPPQRDDELGRLGHYRILRVLGAGGMGIVFQAEDQRLHRQVAVKTLKSNLASNPEFRQRFLREARAAARLNHDHVVTIHQVDEVNGIPFLAMTLLQGETLEARLQRERVLPIHDVVAIGRQVADALATAHEVGLVHRDIKPSNIWLEERTSRVKLLDFGLAHITEREGGHEPLPEPPADISTEEPPHGGLTRPGEHMGTQGYMAPELFLGQSSRGATDLFALGCVLFRCLTGRLPFAPADHCSPAMTRAPETLHALNSGPSALRTLVASLLATHPGDRPDSSARVVAELDRIRAELDGRRQRVRRLLAGSMFAAALLLGAIPFAARGKRATTTEPAIQLAMARQYSADQQPFDVAAADFNGDSQLDLAVSNMGAGTISVLMGESGGSFRAGRAVETGAEPMTIAVGDYNEDRRPDLAVVTAGNDSLDVLLGVGDGTFQRVSRQAVGKRPRGLATTDLDADGHLDLVSSNENSDLTVWYGDGSGRFRERSDFAVQAKGALPAVAAADLNRDGRLDLVAANGMTDTVSVLLASGPRQFHPSVEFAAGSGPGMLALADFNQDENVDVAVENFGSNDVAVLLGNGDGTLRLAGMYNVGSGPGGIEVADFNGDERLDLAVANHLSANVSLLLGQGDGTFLPATHQRVGDTPVGIAVGDFDSDGRTDFAVANHWSKNISVVLNPPPRPTLRVALPLNLRVRQQQSFIVTALDRQGNVVHDFRGTVRFSSDDPQASLPEPYTFEAADDGNHKFYVNFGTVGPCTLEAHCEAPAVSGGTVVMIVPPEK